MNRRPRSFWQRSREWPVIGQIAFAVAVILVAAGVSGGIANALHPDKARDSKAAATTVATAAATTLPLRPVRASPIITADTKHAPNASTTVPATPPSSTLDPSHLLPLAIAAASHANTYDRALDFGGFADVDGCKDTRAEVLIRASAVPVSFTNSDDCTVETGRWTDPWSGVTTTVAHDLQIDHTVPLANAWTSGAWSWSHAQRVAYANDLTDTDHLVPILTHENESKIDKGPDGWKPPSGSAWCLYARVWDHIKAKWRLSATTAEWDALVEMAATC